MNPGQHILVFALRLYRRLVSPVLTAAFGPMGLGCRFTPTCSEFALEAVRLHGVFRGGWLAIGRLGRCHPWGGCGFDPVPPARRPRSDSSASRAGEADRVGPGHPGGAGGMTDGSAPALDSTCRATAARATTHLESRSNGS